MTIIEDVLLKQIEEVLSERAIIKTRIVQLKKDFYSAETELIRCNIQHENFVENLRKHRASLIDKTLTYREQDIERFTIANVELQKKIK